MKQNLIMSLRSSTRIFAPPIPSPTPRRDVSILVGNSSMNIMLFLENVVATGLYSNGIHDNGLHHDVTSVDMI